jgi:uncharacterized repeat protein (TIGR04076 family)
MANYKIKCSVIDVKTDTGFCRGSAKMKKDENFVITSRTPEGMCCTALSSIYPMVFSIRRSDKMEWERGEDYQDFSCPDGCVTFRISRIME